MKGKEMRIPRETIERLTRSAGKKRQRRMLHTDPSTKKKIYDWIDKVAQENGHDSGDVIAFLQQNCKLLGQRRFISLCIPAIV